MAAEIVSNVVRGLFESESDRIRMSIWDLIRALIERVGFGVDTGDGLSAGMIIDAIAPIIGESLGLTGKPKPTAEGSVANDGFADSAENSITAATAGTGTQVSRTVIQRAMDTINEVFQSRGEFFANSAPDTAGGDSTRVNADGSYPKVTPTDMRGNEPARPNALEEYAGLLGDKFTQYLTLDGYVSSGDERNILETARNRILIDIERVIGMLEKNTSTLGGSFNIPPGIIPMNEYTYRTKDDDSITRILQAPEINIYMTVDNLGEKDVNKVRQQLNAFAEGIFGENEWYRNLLPPR